MQLLIKSVLIFFIGLMFTETVGFNVYKSTCPMSGRTKVQCVFVSCCCGNDCDNKCCDVETELHDYKPDCFSQFQAVDFDSFQIENLLPNTEIAVLTEIQFSHDLVNVEYDPPPLIKSARRVLIENQRFLI